MTQPIRPLTDAEQRVADLVGKGMDYRAIGERLHISPRTVSVHTYRIAQKLPNPRGLAPYKLVLRWMLNEAA